MFGVVFIWFSPQWCLSRSNFALYTLTYSGSRRQYSNCSDEESYNSDKENDAQDAQQLLNLRQPNNSSQSSQEDIDMPPRTSKTSQRASKRGHYGDDDDAENPGKYAKMEEELERLKAENKNHVAFASQIREAGGVKKLAKKTMNRAVMVEIITAVRSQNVWGKVKFLTANHEDRYLNMVLDEMGFGHSQSATWIENWKNTYGDYAVKQLNEARSYVQSQLRTVVLNYMDNNPSPPQLTDILKCLNRDINLEDDDEMELFEWYWDEFLPKATCNCKVFKDSQRHYATISTAAPLNEPNNLYMSISNEAFAVLMFENNRTRWMRYKEVKDQNAHSNKKLTAAKFKQVDGKPSKIPGQEGETQETPKEILVFGDKFRGKWSKCDSGQAKYGGWSADGLKRYKALRALAKAGRAKADCQTIEEASLHSVRQRLQLTQDTYEQEQRLKAKAKRNEEIVVEEEVDTWSTDDEQEP